MAAALAQARSGGLIACHWAHDVRLRDGTVPVAACAAAIVG